MGAICYTHEMRQKLKNVGLYAAAKSSEHGNIVLVATTAADKRTDLVRYGTVAYNVEPENTERLATCL